MLSSTARCIVAIGLLVCLVQPMAGRKLMGTGPTVTGQDLAGLATLGVTRGGNTAPTGTGAATNQAQALIDAQAGTILQGLAPTDPAALDVVCCYIPQDQDCQSTGDQNAQGALIAVQIGGCLVNVQAGICAAVGVLGNACAPLP